MIYSLLLKVSLQEILGCGWGFGTFCVRTYYVLVPLKFIFLPSKRGESWEVFFILAHFQPPTDRLTASRQSLILLDISPPSSKWTQFILGLIVCMSTAVDAVAESIERNEKRLLCGHLHSMSHPHPWLPLPQMLQQPASVSAVSLSALV